MRPHIRAVEAPPPALLALLNAVPNVFWSVLAFVPVGIFCYQHVARLWLYVFVATSLLVYVFPVSLFHHLQLSSKPAFYRRLGVPLVNRVTQNGQIVNGLLRRRYPGYRALPSRAAMVGVLRTTYVQEQFHWAAFLFFLVSALYAALHAHPGWSLLIILINVLYNLYPIWLQQYIRVRLNRFGAYPV
jgi:hypothetical protein